MCLLTAYNFLVFIHGTLPEAYILMVGEGLSYSLRQAFSYFIMNFYSKEYYAFKISFPLLFVYHF